ncbi:hypothetical protein Ga0609869_003614 [Rhodovulum iodosum]|uniref:Uncharacterized protein n=1 Tax=Rhodovulum iodosum TaxID=68291 RepID=A0ABV3XY06_9RHOB|nr:hypothetical protein [Rhodovulum robiginosum]RSK38886.1 hypothetical protein EJA01_01685 [Rhodovulum robiginosum]
MTDAQDRVTAWVQPPRWHSRNGLPAAGIVLSKTRDDTRHRFCRPGNRARMRVSVPGAETALAETLNFK